MYIKISKSVDFFVVIDEFFLTHLLWLVIELWSKHLILGIDDFWNVFNSFFF